MAHILVIDDQDRTIALCRRVMPESEWGGPARSWAEAQAALRSTRGGVDLVLLDVHFDIPTDQLLGLGEVPDPTEIKRARRRQGFFILEELRRGYPDLPVVLMTAQGEGLEKAADRHHAQEYTYFLDDEDLDARALRAQVESILRVRRGTERDGPVYWGRTLQMRRIRQRLSVLARGRLPVILQGPTGTGKSLIARHFIHARSGRKGAFVAVDLSTIPRDLVAAQLFGAQRGAYTGSVADRRGAFEEADHGTLFLDEIGNLGEEVQKMLLTVLQEGAVVRIGDNRERNVDVKVVVATNEELGELVRAGKFRADLFMRLNPAATVSLPPLRDRASDLDHLVAFCVERAAAEPTVVELAREYRERVGLDATGAPQLLFAEGDSPPAQVEGALVLLFPDRSLELLRRHRWPGNLRELAMTLENAVTLSLAEALEAGPQPVAAGGTRRDLIQVRPKLVRDLLLATGVEPLSEAEGRGLRMELVVRPHDGLNKVAQDVERQYFTRLFLQEKGDFAAMATALMGDADAARKVQLRFNQLGLKVRDLKDRIP